jgi:hypothetical protein
MKSSRQLAEDLSALGVKVPDGSDLMEYDGKLRIDYGDGKSTLFDPNDPKQLQGVIDKFGSIGQVLRAGQKPIGEWNNNDFDNVVARERFNIPELKKISDGGSDRTVLDLGDDKVLKVVKTARGLDQQSSSADWYAEERGLIPKTFEVGKNYVVKEKVLPPDKNVKQMLKEIAEVPAHKQSGQLASFVLEKYAEIMNKHGYAGDEIYNYPDVLAGDLQAVRNWGTTKEGKPVLIDEGTLNGKFVNEWRTKVNQGVTNLTDPAFREIYNQSKTAKQKFGDTDKWTMFGLAGALGLGSVVPKKKKEDKQPSKWGSLIRASQQ